LQVVWQQEGKNRQLPESKSALEVLFHYRVKRIQQQQHRLLSQALLIKKRLKE
jgi:hypothetical protein